MILGTAGNDIVRSVVLRDSLLTTAGSRLVLTILFKRQEK
jgi:hypothetical protein